MQKLLYSIISQFSGPIFSTLMSKSNIQHIQRLLYTVLISHKHKIPQKTKLVCDGCIYEFYPKLGDAAAIAILCGSVKSSLSVTISITMMMLLVFFFCQQRMTLKNAELEIAANKNNGFLQTSSRFLVTAGALFHICW